MDLLGLIPGLLASEEQLDEKPLRRAFPGNRRVSSSIDKSCHYWRVLQVGPQGFRLVGLLRATHLQPSLVVAASATYLSLIAGRDVRGCFVVAISVLLAQFSVGWSNDWLDAQRDLMTDRTDKPIVAGLVPLRLVRRSAFIALGLATLAGFLSGWRAGVVLCVATLSAWLYNLRLKDSLLSPLPYAISFGLLPVFVTLGLTPEFWPKIWTVLAAAALGVGAHFINTLPDRDEDQMTGIRGLPQRLPAPAVLVIGTGLFLTAGLIIYSQMTTNRIAGLVLLLASLLCDLAVLVEAARSHIRRTWSWALGSAVMCVILFGVAGTSLLHN